MTAARVMLGIPFYETVQAIPVAKWERPCAPDSPHRYRKVFNGSSCLTSNFNSLLAEALSSRGQPNSPTHLGMVHADVAPDGYWLDVLLAEMEATGADLLSVVLPIKTEGGETSTVIDDPFTGEIRRLTMRQLAELPRTFDAAAAGYPGKRLLVSTGLWILDLRKPWVEYTWPSVYTPELNPPCFTVPNRLIQRPDGTWDSAWFSEDWNFSRMLQRLGARLLATKAVACGHWGQKEYRNDQVWGMAEDPGSDCGWANEGRLPRGRECATVANGTPAHGQLSLRS